MEEEAKEILKQYNQEHIINWMEKVDKKTKKEIIEQVINIDLEELQDLYKKVQRGIVQKNFKVTPIKAIEKEKLTKSEEDEYVQLGEKTLKNCEYAVVTMAGGQGTRLRTFWP